MKCEQISLPYTNHKPASVTGSSDRYRRGYFGKQLPRDITDGTNTV